MSELEQHHPDDPESMGTDAVCPSVAWDVHGDLGQAREALREVAEVLQKAADRTPETVRAAWLRRRLAADEPRAALAKVSEGLAELERQGVREPEISDFRGSLAELAAHLRELAADPEAAAEPRADAGADLAEIAA